MARTSKKSKTSTIVLWILAILFALGTAYVVYSYSISKSDIIADSNFADGLGTALEKAPGKITAEELAEYEDLSVQSNAYMTSIYSMYGIDTAGMDTEGYSVVLTLPGYDSTITSTEDSTAEEKKAAEENQKLVKSFSTKTISYKDMSLFTGLKNVSIYYDEKFDDISVFAGCKDKLESLMVYGGALGDISAVADYTKLTSLSLAENGITDISSIAGLTELTSLTLDNNQITDISAVSGLTKLETLSIDSNTIADISAIKGLSALKNFSASSTTVKDLDTVVSLKNLETIALNSNGITDIAPLANLDMTKVTSLSLDGNEITDWTPVDAIKDKVVGYPKPEEETADGEEAVTDGEVTPDGETTAEGEAKPEGEAEPDGEATTEGETKPEAETTPDSEAKPEGETDTDKE